MGSPHHTIEAAMRRNAGGYLSRCAMKEEQDQGKILILNTGIHFERAYVFERKEA